jgi:hypothetical protein
MNPGNTLDTPLCYGSPLFIEPQVTAYNRKKLTC